jgi:murein DD-endopeptidase MepM/ murein hydrolase activator NlpD
MVSRIVGLGLISACALVAPAPGAQRDLTPVPRDLGEAILGGPVLEGRDVLGRSAALVSAAQGRAFVIEVAQGVPTAQAIATASPVYKAFGLNASGELLAYRPLAGNVPSGDLVVEDVVTRTNRRITSRYVVEAAWSPRDRNLLAITFANGEGYGLALLDTRTGSPRVIRRTNVLADYLAWEDDGSGIYYYDAVDRQRRGVSSETGLVVVEQPYTVLTPSFHDVRPRRVPTSRASAESVANAVLPAGFPVVDHRAGARLADPVLEQLGRDMAVEAQSLQAAELPEDLYSFRVASPAGDYEVQGRDLLSDDDLYLRALPDGRAWRIGRGHVVKVTDDGILYRTANVDGSTLRFVTWTGEQAFVSSAVVPFGIPFPSAYVTQGGQGYPSPGCGTYYYTHKTGTSMAYAYDFVNNPGHILASAPGTAVYVKKDVTCNSCAGASCPDYVSGCSANSGWGNVVILEHADGTWTKYTHIKTNYAWVALGQSVCAGFYIAFQGHTGCASGGTCGDHLHFQRQSSSALSGTSLPVDFFDAADPLACYKSYPSSLSEVTTCPTTCVDTAVPPTSWKGEYFAGTALAGTALMVRNEGTGTLGFDWGATSPGCSVPADGFSARFTRSITFPAATHRFTVTSDDGVRVWVDGALYLDKWIDQGPTTYTFDVPLTAGSHTVKIEYYENAGGAALTLSWQALGGVAQFVCDDGDSCLTFSGPSAYWHRATACGTAALGYGGDVTWTYVNGSIVSNSAKWTPALGGPGTYQVSVFVPRCNATSQLARYKVVHNGQTEYKTVNQNAYYDAWVPLGSFAFTGAAGEYVELTDATGESYTTRRMLGFDAIKWDRQ